MTKYEIKGREYWFYYNAAAMFELMKHGDAVTQMSGTEASSLEAACIVAQILGEQGELMRRHLGHDRGDMPDATELQLIATPRDLLRLKDALVREIKIGLEVEVEPEEDIDLGLQKLAQKNKKK